MKILAVGGGKGGIGKSVMAASLGVGLAKIKHPTVVVDADLGGSNLHTIFGIQTPETTFSDILEGRVSVEEVLSKVPEVENLRVLCGASGTYGIANLKYQQKQKFIRKIRNIEAEFVILDLGAGTNYNVLDLFRIADYGIILVTADPLSVLDGYNFTKQIFYRDMFRALKDREAALDILEQNASLETFKDQQPVSELLEKIRDIDPRAEEIMQEYINEFTAGLIINKVKKDEDEANGQAVRVAADELLSLDIEFLGSVHYDDTVPRSVEAMQPFMLFDAKSQASKDLAGIILKGILSEGKIRSVFKKREMRKPEKEPVEEYKDTVICSVKCMYWDDCPFKQGGYPCKMQHLLSIGGFQERSGGDREEER